MDDVCAAKDIKLQCRALADYSMACSKSGVVLGDWREVVTECGRKTFNFQNRSKISRWY